MKRVKHLNQMTLLTLVSFAVVAVSLTYWSVFAAPGMLARPDNPRRVEAEQAIHRGAIVDRGGNPLAYNLDVHPLPSGWLLQQRVYPFPEVAHAVGYYSLNYGVGGTEDAFDRILRGDDLRDENRALQDSVLHRAEVGSDVRLTLDLNLQKTIASALSNRRGAIVVLDVPSGAVLAMVSQPTFDANQLDANYKTLIADGSAPLLNRVTQGTYQPGGILETVILAAMLTDKQTLDSPAAESATPLRLNGLTLACAAAGNAGTLGLAYARACPTPFTVAAVNKPASLQTMIDAFGLSKAPILVGYRTLSGFPPPPLNDASALSLRVQSGAGQGPLTVTPLQMALVAATIANHGNMITPYMASAVHRPGAADWTMLDKPDTFPAVIAADVADTIRIAMKTAVAEGAARRAAHDKLTIYGHAAIAYTGQTADSWFIGFVDRPDGHSVAVAVVIEDSEDAGLSASIGGTALGAANTP